MPFPWGQPFVDQPLMDLAFICQHCKTTHRNEHGAVTVCMCPGAVQERLEQAERDAAFQRSQQAAASMSFNEAREQRKLRSKSPT